MQRRILRFVVSICFISITNLVSATDVGTKDATFLINICHGKTEFDLHKNISVPSALIAPRFVNSSFDLKFRLNKQILDCDNGSSLISWSSPEKNKTSIVNLNIKISPVGYLKNNEEVYEKEQFCVDEIDENKWKFQVCNRICNEKSPCFKKCCEPDEVWDISQFAQSGRIKCRPAGNVMWKPRLYSDLNNKLTDAESQKLQINFNSSHPRDWCKFPSNVVTLRDIGSHKHSLYRILKNGNVKRKIDKKEFLTLVAGTFCVDGAQNFSGDSLLYTGDEKDDVLISCYQISKEKFAGIQNQRKVSLLYGIVLVIGSVFLLITFVVHILQWEKLNVHVWTQVAYITSLFFTYVFLASNHFLSMTIVRTDDDNSSISILCRAIAILAHWFFLSVFSWLSVTCFDVYMTFRALKPTASKSRGLKKLMYYAIFALGVPSIIVTVGIIFDYKYRYDIESNVITPEYGGVTCWLDLKYAVLPYFYIPIGTLFAVNVIFFALTIRSLYLIQQSTKFATSSSSKTEKNNQSVILFSKLFLVMGIPWIFEVTSWATMNDYNQTPWYTVITDILVLCQAFAIFGIFVMKRETLQWLGSKYPKLKKFDENFITMNSDRKTLLRKDNPILYWCIMCLCCSNWNINKNKGESSKSSSAPTHSSSAGGDSAKYVKSQTAASKIGEGISTTQKGENKGEEIEMK